MVEGISSPLDIFTRLHHDNNHPLNSFFLYIVGDQKNWVVYRLLSIVCGIVSVGAMGLIARREGEAEAFTAMLLAAFSFPLILYSSEARGYSPAILFALLSFIFIRKYMESKNPAFNVLYILSAILGFLSHLTFVFVFIAFGVWWAYLSIAERKGRRDAAIEFLKLHLAPIIFIIFLYYVHVRRIFIGRGPFISLPDVLSGAITLTIGAGETGLIATVALLTLGMVSAIELTDLKKQKPDMFYFYIALFFAAPIIVLLIARPVYLYPRYFIVISPFLLLFIGRFVCRCYRRGYPLKIIYLAALVLFFAGNSQRIIAFLEDGRGHYLEAVVYMSEKTEGATIEVGSNNDSTIPMVLQFYSRYLPEGKILRYVNYASIKTKAPEWTILQNQKMSKAPPSQFTTKNGGRYNLTRSFPYSVYYGWNWHLFRRE